MLRGQRDKKEPIRELKGGSQVKDRLGIVASLIITGRKCFKKQRDQLFQKMLTGNGNYMTGWRWQLIMVVIILVVIILQCIKSKGCIP